MADGQRARVALHDRYRRVRRDRRRGRGARRRRDRRAGERWRGRRGRGPAHRVRRRNRRRGGARPPGARDLRRSGAPHGRARSRAAHEAAQQRAERRALRARARRARDRRGARPRPRRRWARRCATGAVAASRSRCSSGSARSTRSPTTSARSWRRTSACSNGRPAARPTARCCSTRPTGFSSSSGIRAASPEGARGEPRPTTPRGRASTPARARSARPRRSTPATFWAGEWRDALARNGARAAADAERLGLPPLAIAVDGDVWTLRRGERTLEVVPGTRRDDAAGRARPRRVRRPRLRAANRARSRDRRAGRRRVPRRTRRSARGIPCCAPRSTGAACTGPATSRCARSTARRSISTNGSGSAIDPPRPRTSSPRPGSCSCRACSPTTRWTRSTPTSPRAVDAAPCPTTARRGGRRRAPASATRAASSTSPGSRTSLRALLADPRFLAIGELLGDGHRPGDPFGEHFAEVTAEGLREAGRLGRGPRVPAVAQGLRTRRPLDVLLGPHRRDLPDAGRRGARRARRRRRLAPGEHRPRPGRPRARPSARHAPRRSRRPHRAHVVRAAPLDASRRAASGASPTPASRCRRGPATAHADDAQPRLRRERAAIGDPSTRPRLASEIEPGASRR